jgi:SAM-dependent methyltransferase
MHERSEWDHNRWARLYAEFERDFVEAPRRLFIEIAQLRTSPPVHRVLDIGCGDGKGLEYLRSRLPGAELVGIDPDPVLLKIARTRLRDRAQVTVASAEDFAEDLGRFDLILSYMNLRLWADPVRGLKRVQAALTDHGMAYIADIRRDIPPSVRENGLRRLPQGTFREVSAAQIDSALTVDEVQSRLKDADITTYALTTRIPLGRGRVGRRVSGAGSKPGPMAKIASQLSKIESGGTLEALQCHLFIYPRQNRTGSLAADRAEEG